MLFRGICLICKYLRVYGYLIANECNLISLLDNYEDLPSGWAYGIFVNIPCALEIDVYCLVVTVF